MKGDGADSRRPRGLFAKASAASALAHQSRRVAFGDLRCCIRSFGNLAAPTSRVTDRFCSQMVLVYESDLLWDE